MQSLSIRVSILLLAVAYGPWITAGAVHLDGFGCIVQGPDLNIAKQHFAAQCSQPRADCDPHDGRWYCASFKMNQTTPLYVFDLGQNTNASHNSNSTPVTSTTDQPAQNHASANTTANTDWSSPDEQNSAVDKPGNNAAHVNASDESHFNSAKTPADITDLILITGQSNALGADTTYDAALDKPHERVFAFTDQGWQVASLKQVWDLGWFPRTHPGSEPSNNFAFHFAKQLVNTRADRTVGFVLATAPGQAIKHWRYQGEFYRSVESKVIDAINQLPHKAKIDGVLWHQGETDANDTQEYTDALYTLIYYLRTESWTDYTLPFICGETKQLAVNNRLNGLNRDSDPYTACVRGSDLSTFADGHHFDTAGLRTLGARYADAYRNMLDR